MSTLLHEMANQTIDTTISSGNDHTGSITPEIISTIARAYPCGLWFVVDV